MGSLADFSKMFPDAPPQVAQFSIDSNKYINGSIDSNILIGDINSLTNMVNLLKTFQGNIIRNTPEYTNVSLTSNFLNQVSTVTATTSTLQLQLQVAEANVINSQLKAAGNLSSIVFYTYTTATIILGIICIALITYLVYTYVYASPVSYSSIKGGFRKSILH
jgi:hypothetical protein